MSTPLRTARALRAGTAIGRTPSADRAAPSARQVTLAQTYGPPNAETPLYEFQLLAANAYGSSGLTNSYAGASGHGGNAVIFGLIDKRLSVFTEARFKYRNLSDKRLFGDASLSKLEVPWPDGTTGDLWARMEQDVSLAGNAFIRDCGDQLERLRPDWVTIVSEVTTDVFGHEVRRVIGFFYDPVGDIGREADFYPVAEVAHWAPIPDPLANFRGMSWLTAVLREIDGDIRMTEYREAFFKNAATPNLVIKYSQKMAPERLERLQTAMQARHTGPVGAFGTLVLDEGADLMVVGQDMEGSAFDKLQAAGETRLALAAGVPAIVAGLRQGLQASAIGEYEQALRAFADLKVRPNWRSACGALAKLVQVPAGAELWYDTSDVSALQAGEQDKASTMVAQSEAINKLIMAGYEPDSVTAAVIAGDLSLLKHSGLVSVQMQKLEDKTVPSVPNPETPNGLQLPISAHINGNTPQIAAA